MITACCHDDGTILFFQTLQITVSRRFCSDGHIFQTMYGMPFGPGAELLRFRFRTDVSSEKDGGHCLKADVGSSQAGKSSRASKTELRSSSE